MHKKIKFVLIFLLFFIGFFIPRYFAHLQYDATGDEILSIMFIKNNSLKDLLLAPDYVHPGLWYASMNSLVQALDINHGIFYYRFFQVMILFSSIVFSFFFFYKKLSRNFLIIFFILFLSNVYLVHLTMQFRMYAAVIGVSIFYSLYWYDLISDNSKKSYKHFILLALVGSLGFFINYSIFWIIPIWPTLYFLHKKDKHSIKQVLIFFISFLISISWFISIFIRNISMGISKNQWAPELNLINTLEMVGTYFGLIPKIFSNEINFLVFPFIILLFLLNIFQKKSSVKLFFIPLTIVFFSFICIVFLTGNSLLYARTTIPIVVTIYIFMTDAFYKNKYAKFIVFLLVFFQLSQFVVYFFPHKNFAKSYDSFNYHLHPINYFTNRVFEDDSCLITIPDWNKLSAKYFFKDKMKVIDVTETDLKNRSCSKIYVLDQTSTSRDLKSWQFKKIDEMGYKLDLVDRYDDQDLYTLLDLQDI